MGWKKFTGVDVHFNVWWIPGKKIISTPSHFYCGYRAISEKMWYHEMKHNNQWWAHIGEYGPIMGRVMMTLRWVFGWVFCGFRWSKIPMEIEAVAAEKNKSNHKFLSVEDLKYGR